MLPGNERIETNLRLALELNGSYDDAIGISASDTELVKNLNNAGYAAWLQGDFVAARAYLSRSMEIRELYYDRAATNLAAVHPASGTSRRPPMVSNTTNITSAITVSAAGLRELP